MKNTEEQSSNAGCTLAVVAVIVFVGVGVFVSDESNVFVGGWAALIAAITVYFVGAKLLSK